MRYRCTEDNAVRVSEVGLGTYCLAGVYGPKDENQFKRVLRRAFELGVTFFDVAPVYGSAEEVVGDVLGDVRKEIVISTKVAADLGAGLSCSFDHVIASCERSLKRLNTDHIDLFQIHFDDGKTPAAEVVRAFDELKASGKIRACGIGHVALQRAREYLCQGSVSTVMGELSAVGRRYYTKMLPVAKEGGASYIGFSLTGRGVLTGAVESREHLSKQDIRRIDALFAGQRVRSALRVRKRLAGMAEQIGATAAQTGIRWALSQERVVTGLVGPSSLEHLEEDLKVSAIDIPDQLLVEFEDFLSREESGLAEALRREIASILQQGPSGPDAVGEMIYAIEGLAELDLAPEAELIPHIKTLMKLRSGCSDDTPSLDVIRNHLRRFIDAQ